MRVATFNLLHGRSIADGSVSEESLRDAARRLDADVVGLQEVDRGQDRSHGVDQTAVMADELGAARWRFVPSLHGTPGTAARWTAALDDSGGGSDDGDAGEGGPTYGVGLVSRLPVRSFAVRRFRAAPVGLPLMVPGRPGLTQVPDEPRVGVAAVLDGPAGPFTVVTTHLTFVPGWNIAQLRALTHWARGMPAPRLMIGDFNLPGRLPRIATRWTQLARVATYPSWRPRVQFDHVLSDGVPESAVRSVEAVRPPVSDHCALVVDLDV